eukprot:GSChrysophyteH1.ASY1.ANO1.505.1 assembled CDS
MSPLVRNLCILSQPIFHVRRFPGFSSVFMRRWSSSIVNDLQELKDGSKTLSNRPFTLPPGQFKPKQSLGQNFLSDQNYVNKICNAFTDDSPRGLRVVEVGPGPGALSRVLFPRYPHMTAIEVDKRAVSFLAEKLPGLRVVHQDVLTVDWMVLAEELGGPVSVIANLPYYIVSQVLFSLADAPQAVEKAVVTMQLEVAQRVTARPNTKQYGIPSVVFQLYCTPKLNFKIPPTVFYPKPAVDSALVTLDFNRAHPILQTVHPMNLRKVLVTAFQKRRKMLRSSLKQLVKKEELSAGIPEKWATRRPESLTPVEFVQLTAALYGDQARRWRGSEVSHATEVWRRDITSD